MCNIENALPKPIYHIHLSFLFSENERDRSMNHHYSFINDIEVVIQQYMIFFHI